VLRSGVFPAGILTAPRAGRSRFGRHSLKLLPPRRRLPGGCPQPLTMEARGPAFDSRAFLDRRHALWTASAFWVAYAPQGPENALWWSTGFLAGLPSPGAKEDPNGTRPRNERVFWAD